MTGGIWVLATIALLLALIGLAAFIGFRRIIRRSYLPLAIMGLALYGVAGISYAITLGQPDADPERVGGFVAFLFMNLLGGGMVLGVIVGAIYAAIRPAREPQGGPKPLGFWDVILFGLIAAAGLALSILG